MSTGLQVLHLITELEMGGAQTALFNLLKHLPPERYSSVVVSLYDGDGAAADRIRALNIPVIDLQMNSKYRLDKVLHLGDILSRRQPDILHTWMFHANLLGRLMGSLAKIPIIITSRRNVEIGGRLRERMKQLTNQMDDAIITVCEAARQAEIQRCKAAPEKVTTIHNGIHPPDLEVSESDARRSVRSHFDIPPDSILMGSIGRLHPQKGFEKLLDALALVKEKAPTSRLLVVGDGVLRSQLEDFASFLGLEEAVTFSGAQDRIPEILSALDIFVLPSLWEGLPNVVLEAMAARLPVVATAVGGTPEVVIDGETGLLVPPSNPDELAKAILTLIENPALRIKFGQAGRERVEKHFTIQETVRKTEVLYMRLLREKGVIHG